MRKIHLIVLLVLLSACTSSPISNTSTVLPQVTNTSVYSVATVEVKPTDDHASIIKLCVDNTTMESASNTVSGRLIVESEKPLATHIIDLLTNKQTPLGNGRISNISVSPDRKWIAYISGGIKEKDELLVVQSVEDGQRYIYAVQPEEWQSISHWLSNGRIVLWNHKSQLDNIVVLDPLNGSKKSMPTNFPDILPIDDDWDFYWPSITIYNQTLTKVLYVAKAGDKFRPGFSKLVLWDVVGNKPVTEVPNFGYSLVYPLWLHNGDEALFAKSIDGYDPPVAQDEIYSINLDGTVKQLTHLSDYFLTSRITSFSLSSDERFLAIVVDASLAAKEGVKSRLLILDLKNLIVQDLCINPERFSPLVWSPESYQLAISISQQAENYRTIVIDTVQAKIIRTFEWVRPRGWLR